MQLLPKTFAEKRLVVSKMQTNYEYLLCLVNCFWQFDASKQSWFFERWKRVIFLANEWSKEFSFVVKDVLMVVIWFTWKVGSKNIPIVPLVADTVVNIFEIF